MSIGSRIRGAGRALFAQQPDAVITTDAIKSTEAQGHPAEYYFSLNDHEAVPSIDDLVNDKGLAPYREMPRRDDACVSGIRMIQYARLSTEMKTTAASDDVTDKDVYAAVNEAFARAGGLLRFLEACLDCVAMGFSVIEKRWGKPEEWTAPSGKVYHLQFPRALVPLPQETIAIKRDEYGEVEPDGVWQSKTRQIVTPSLQPQFFNHFDPRDFVVFSWSRQWDNPYGMSLLRPAYRWYVGKDRVISAWLRYLERFGFPLAKVKVDSKTGKTERAAIARELSKQMTEQGVVLSGMDLELVELSHTASSSFRDAIHEANRGMLRAILQPALVMENEGTTGSNALGSSQINQTFSWPIENLGLHAENEAVLRGFVEDFVRWNFGARVQMPKCKFEEFVPRNITALGQQIEMGVNLGIPTPAMWAAKIMGVPAAEKDEPLLNRMLGLQPGAASDDQGIPLPRDGEALGMPGAQKVQDEGLNGAQIQSIADIIGQVSRKEFAPESAKDLLKESFPRMAPERIDSMVGAAVAFKVAIAPKVAPAELDDEDRIQMQEFIDEYDRALTSADPAEVIAYHSGEAGPKLNGVAR